jgi:hypothetical protein
MQPLLPERGMVIAVYCGVRTPEWQPDGPGGSGGQPHICAPDMATAASIPLFRCTLGADSGI